MIKRIVMLGMVLMLAACGGGGGEGDSAGYNGYILCCVDIKSSIMLHWFDHTWSLDSYVSIPRHIRGGLIRA